ncbi:MAG: hypothetical protein SGI88_07805 [Candidatus Hydrogenedentes bacterium]|nr:hypothetical protein [Candidatus Hydrogenedentota bacterium]
MEIGELVTAIVFILFAVSAVVKRLAEGREASDRKDEPQSTAEDLPEETRRMLFGDSGPPKTRPAARTSQLDPFDEPRHVAKEQRSTFEPQTAKPRQGTPRPPKPPTPRREPQPVRQQPRQQSARPVEDRRPPVPPRHAPQHQQQPMTPRVSEGQMPRQQQPPVRRQPPQAPQHRQPAATQTPSLRREAAEGPRPQPQPRVAVQQPVRARRPRNKWLASKDDVRRAMVLIEILGPPKGLQ